MFEAGESIDWVLHELIGVDSWALTLLTQEVSINSIFSDYGVTIDGDLPHSRPRNSPEEMLNLLKKNMVEIRASGNYPSIRDCVIARQLLSGQSGHTVTADTLYQLDAQTEKLIHDTFMTENQRACELIGIDLSKYGYIV